MRSSRCRPCVWAVSLEISLEGSALRKLVVGKTMNPDYVFIIGREHPPQISSSLGLMRFIDAIAGEIHLARIFRRHFPVLVVPVVKPDEVAHGHWRRILGGWICVVTGMISRSPKLRLCGIVLLAMPENRAPALICLYIFIPLGQRLFTPCRREKTSCIQISRTAASRICIRIVRDFILSGTMHTIASGQLPNRRRTPGWAPAITCEFGHGTNRELAIRAVRIAAPDILKILLVDAEHGSARIKQIYPGEMHCLKRSWGRRCRS